MSRDLSRLLHPRSVVFIGGSECDVAIGKCRALGFGGKIRAVNPKRASLGGIATVARLDDIDAIPDAAFVAVKREPTIEIVAQLARMGCGGAVIYASGFAETGHADLQSALLHAANGMPLMGPNCYGFVDGLSRAALWPDEHGITPVERGVAIITQSGNIACNLTFTRRALPLACVYTIGNQADIDVATMTAAMVRDDRITAIGLHIEGLKDVVAFAQVAELARQHKKPIVALKTGRSEQGAKVTMSHTSSLAGADRLYDALFARCGVARATSLTSFVETLKFLHHGGPLANNHVVSLSCSGGEAALIADMALVRDVAFPPFPPQVRANVAATLNDYVAVENPLDYHTFIWNQRDRLEATFTAVLKGAYDVGLLILDTPSLPDTRNSSWLVTARAFAGAAKTTGARAVVAATLPETMPLTLADELSACGITPLYGLDDALSAIAAACHIGRCWAKGAALPPHGPIARGPIASGSGGVETLGESVAKQELHAFGLPIPEGQLCAAEEAVDVAETLGFPVTLKASSAALAHKTEAGAVFLNLKTAAEVAQAATSLRALSPELLVEQMITGSICELIIGVVRDPQFGLALLIGAGGIYTELLQDTTMLLLPTSSEDARQALETLKIWKIIAGCRGRSGDSEAVVAAILAIAKYAEAHRVDLEELDVNPLLVLPTGAVAVDALIRLVRN